MRRGSGGRRGRPAPLEIEGYSDLVEIGSGTSATVYSAFQEAFQRQVALKLLTADISDQRAQKRFVSERAMTGRLSRHPNIITVYDSGFAAGRQPYLAMEYFARGSYANVIDVSGPLLLNNVLRVGVKMAGALESAHRAGVIHRDIKPQNILLSGFGEPVLADFGLAIALDPEASFTAGLTPAHAAPELLEGSQPTVATDIYALGSTLYALLAGRGPFTGPVGEGLLAQFRRIALGDVPDIPRGDLPPSVMATLRRALATQPGNRFRTAAELGRALQNEQSVLGLPVTDLVLEAETAMAPTSRSIVDPRSIEETATRAAVFAPPPVAPPPPVTPPPVTPPPPPAAPEAPTLLGRTPAPPPAPTPRKTRRKAATIAFWGIGGALAAGIGIAIAASGVLGSTSKVGASASPKLSAVPSPTMGSPSPTPPAPPPTSPPVAALTQDPSAPTGVKATVTGIEVRLSWQDHTGKTAQYLVLTSTRGAGYTSAALPRGTTSTVVTLATAMDPTCFEVKAAISLGRLPAAPPVCINGGVPLPTVTPSP